MWRVGRVEGRVSLGSRLGCWVVVLVVFVVGDEVLRQETVRRFHT
jgi:hypothetical protein